MLQIPLLHIGAGGHPQATVSRIGQGAGGRHLDLVDPLGPRCRVPAPDTVAGQKCQFRSAGPQRHVSEPGRPRIELTGVAQERRLWCEVPEVQPATRLLGPMGQAAQQPAIRCQGEVVHGSGLQGHECLHVQPIDGVQERPRWAGDCQVTAGGVKGQDTGAFAQGHFEKKPASGHFPEAQMRLAARGGGQQPAVRAESHRGDILGMGRLLAGGPEAGQRLPRLRVHPVELVLQRPDEQTPVRTDGVEDTLGVGGRPGEGPQVGAEPRESGRVQRQGHRRVIRRQDQSAVPRDARLLTGQLPVVAHVPPPGLAIVAQCQQGAAIG